MRAIRSIDINEPAKPISDVCASTKSITPYVRLEIRKLMSNFGELEFFFNTNSIEIITPIHCQPLRIKRLQIDRVSDVTV